MASIKGRTQNIPKEIDSQFSIPILPSSRRTLSLSSSPSISSSNSSLGSMSFPDSPLSPTTPLRFPRIPFSWEKLPGIPKKQTPNKNKNPSLINLLPLPPAGNPIPTRKEISPPSKEESFRKDPFFAALVECSKDDDGDHERDSIRNFLKESRVRRTFSDRFGFVNMYTSCKSSNEVSESIVYLPKVKHT